MDIMNLTAVILAGGQGTRLKALLNGKPKPMIPTSTNDPFLSILLEELKQLGIRHVVILTGYKAECIQNYFGSGKHLGLNIQYSNESSPLGTAGALFNAKHLLHEKSFALLNGDTYVEKALAKLFAVQNNYGIYSMLAVKHKNAKEYGAITFDEKKYVSSFNEKAERPHESYINAGSYIFDPSIFNYETKKKILH
ncbi:MAG: nucleotidyltransferase family protein [Coxiellaceae bacterium]|nr:nucleotidyltransferase family protein [Coxiellaceae bacterium]